MQRVRSLNRIIDIGKRYVLVGIASNTVGYLSFTFLIFINVFESITRAFLCSSLALLPISYAANRIWVFNSSQNVVYESIKFCFTYACAVFAGVTSIQIFANYFDNPYLIQFLSALVIGASTFVVNLLWTFRNDGYT